MLARSASHHQLVGRPLAYHMRGVGGYAAARNALLDDSGSDYETDLLTNPYPVGGPPSGILRSSVAGRGIGMAPGYKTAAASSYYDPKAAEFSQYLMEQQEIVAAEEQQQHRKPVAQATISDEDDNNGAAAYYAGGSGLTRSRSCILGPSAKQQQQQQQKYATSGAGGSGSCKKTATEHGKLGTSGWDPSNGS